MIEIPEKSWGCEASEVSAALDVAVETGLSRSEAARRCRQFGANRLSESAKRSAWWILFDQMKSLIVALLAVAAVISFAVGEVVDAGAIVTVILINTAIGFFTELRAVRSMEALRLLGGATAVVRRGGQISEVSADTLVPGDIIILEAGDSLTADMRLVEGSKLQSDESALTGESIPVSKHSAPIAADTPLAERSNMLFKGTFLTRGSGTGVVVGIGMNTELGEISGLVEEAARQEDSPLEKRLDHLGRKLIWLTLAITAFVALLGIARGKDLVLMIETSVALAVAAIPEGLPIVATIALARGMMRLARRRVLIRGLAAVETLGATTVICTDKTGTLTENRMTVTHLAVASGMAKFGKTVSAEADTEEVRQALETGVLCNNASLAQKRAQGEPYGTGDPVELALLEVGHRYGIERTELEEHLPEEHEVAFDPEVKMMATYHRRDGEWRVAVKGAPEAVLAISNRVRSGRRVKPMDETERHRWEDRNEALAAMGLRVLALAGKQVSKVEEEPYRELVFEGLAAMEDPPRADVRSAIEACRNAGVRVVMVTGDQPVTAWHIALEIGLVEPGIQEVVTGKDLESPENNAERIANALVLARVSPKQKLDIIDVHRRRGAIVAMTGDGVNDAPALERADIGVAMGVRGTQVAREASDMILGDDALSSIVTAVELGRIIFGNIRKFVVYLLSCNTSEVMVVGLAAVVNAPLPLLPLQILFLNLVTDVFPALALGVGRGDPKVMERPPRDPKEPILPGQLWWSIAGYAAAIALTVLGAMAAAMLGLGMDRTEAVTVSFLTLAFAQLWHVFNMRDRGANLLRNDITQNRILWAALALCIILILLSVQLPLLREVLGTVPIGWHGWTLTLCMSTMPVFLGGLGRVFGKRVLRESM